MLQHGLTAATRLRGPVSLSVSQLPALTRLRAYSSTPDSSHDVAVLGGGITGLAAAYYITKEIPTANVTIYEASDRLGGWLMSKRVPVRDGSVLFEAGPRTLRPSTNGALAAMLMQDLDLTKDAIFPQNTSPAALNRYVYYPDRLVRMPHPSFGFFNNLSSILREPIFEGTIWGFVTELLKNERDSSIKDESVGDFFSRRLGLNVVDRILSGVLHGIYAGDVYQLSARSLFPGPWRDELSAGSLISGILKSRVDGVEVTKREANYLMKVKDFTWDPLLRETYKSTTAFTFRDGLGMFSDGLVRHLASTGKVTFKTSTPVKSIRLSETKDRILVQPSKSHPDHARKHTHIIAALSSPQLNALHHPPTNTTQLIPTIPAVTVMTVNLYYRTPDLAPQGFGYVIPRATPFENNPERALGVVFDTAYSPSPDDVNITNWIITDPAQLTAARDAGRLINVNSFAWYNMPSKPNVQDDVAQRGSKLTVMLGGHHWDGWPAYPDEREGLALAKSLVARHLGITEEPEVYRVNLQKDCIPQYTVGHQDRLMTAHRNISREYNGRLRVVGSWINGVGVNDCLRSAWDVAQGMKEGRVGTGLEDVGTSELVRLKPVRKGGGGKEE